MKKLIRAKVSTKQHRCWFSRKPEYQNLSVEEVFNLDPDYILWCKENLIHLKFAPGLKKRINKYKAQRKLTL